MGTMLVVVPLIGGKDLPGVGLAHDQDVIEGLTPDAADDPLAVGVHRGARGALLITSISSASKTASKALLYLSSRSRSKKRRDSMRVPRSAARCLACCTARFRVGWAVTPLMCRCRVPCSRNASA